MPSSETRVYLRRIKSDNPHYTASNDYSSSSAASSSWPSIFAMDAEPEDRTGLNPKNWQLDETEDRDAGSRLRPGLEALEAARLRLHARAGTDADLDDRLRARTACAPAGSGTIHMCRLLRRTNGSHLASVATALGISRGALIFRSNLRPWDEWERERQRARARASLPAEERFESQCRDYSCLGGLLAMGNNLGEYAILRAAAAAGNIGFLHVRQMCKWDSIVDVQPLLPAAVPAPLPHRPPNFAAVLAVACQHLYPGGTHAASQVWGPFMPQFRRELRAGLSQWRRLASWPPEDAPIDEVAIHLRCADALETRHREYGVQQWAFAVRKRVDCVLRRCYAVTMLLQYAALCVGACALSSSACTISRARSLAHRSPATRRRGKPHSSRKACQRRDHHAAPRPALLARQSDPDSAQQAEWCSGRSRRL